MTVAKVGLSHLEHPGSISTFKPLDPLIDSLNEAESMVAEISSYPTGEDAVNAHWRTLVGNRSVFTQEAPDSFPKIYPTMREPLRRKQARDLGYDRDGKIYTAVWPYLQRLLKTFELMKFCVTEKGDIGLCAEGTQLGDMIYILLGLHTPYILRQCDNRPNYFRLVGQCYIHGITKGEALVSDGFAAQDLFLW